jgi:predicted nucleotide-binding protein
MDAEALLKLLREKSVEFSGLGSRSYASREWAQWRQEIKDILLQVFGDASNELKAYYAATYWTSATVGDQEYRQSESRRRFGEMLVQVEAWLNALILRVERFGAPATAKELPSSQTPAVFIAHGRPSRALDRLREFVEALGCRPIIAEKMPSEDRSVDQNVDYWMGKSHCAVVLATGDDIIEGKIFARPNVHIEIGRFQERFRGRVVYLVEQRLTLPSNIAEKVHERFTRENLTAAFTKVARELRAFGIIKAEASAP